MKKHSIQKKALLTVFCLCCSFHALADATQERIAKLIGNWLTYIQTVPCMIFMTDLDNTFVQSDDKVLSANCENDLGYDYRTLFYQQFIQLICSQPNCYVIFNTARPYMPLLSGQNIDSRAKDAIEKLKIKSSYSKSYVHQYASLGIDLNESPGRTPITGDPDSWLILRQGDGERVLLPKPDILVTGSGSFIQIGSKLSSQIDPSPYNTTVRQWIPVDEDQLDVLHTFWGKEGLAFSPITPATYSQLALFKEPGSPILPRPSNFDSVLPENSLLVWPPAGASEQLVSVQNLVINKGYAAQWIFMKLQESGLISPSENNVICICGDSEGDLPMMKLDLRGAALKPFDHCSPEQTKLLRDRLAALGITEILPEWISKAWSCSAVPRINSLVHCLQEGSSQPRLAQTCEDGLLPMLESMLEIAQAWPKLDSTMFELMDLMEDKEGAYDALTQSLGYAAAAMSNRKRRSSNRSVFSTSSPLDE